LKTRFKIFFSLTLLGVVLFAAVPKVYIHALLGHNHAIAQPTTDISINEAAGTKDCDFEKFDTPVYYTVFKFILNFLPLKNAKEVSFFYHQDSIPTFHYNTSLLRGPPVA
jgi:hypothetical protein